MVVDVVATACNLPSSSCKATTQGRPHVSCATSCPTPVLRRPALHFVFASCTPLLYRHEGRGGLDWRPFCVFHYLSLTFRLPDGWEEEAVPGGARCIPNSEEADKLGPCGERGSDASVGASLFCFDRGGGRGGARVPGMRSLWRSNMFVAEHTEESTDINVNIADCLLEIASWLVSQTRCNNYNCCCLLETTGPKTDALREKGNVKFAELIKSSEPLKSLRPVELAKPAKPTELDRRRQRPDE